jgi:hypothetical protein
MLVGMSYLAAVLGLVGVLQGVAWLGAAADRKLAWRGMVLAPAGVALLACALLEWLVPGFWAG